MINVGSGETTAINQDMNATTTGSFNSLVVVPPTEAQLSALPVTDASLRVLLTDAPINAEHVWAEICGVRVAQHGVDSGSDTDSGSDDTRGWMTLRTSCQRLDILALQNGLTAELGLATLPAGNYGQIRLEVSHVTVVINGQTTNLAVPSGVLKIGHGFQVDAGTLVTLAIDFDAGRSIHFTPGHGYILSPVLSVVGEKHERRGKSQAVRDAGASERADAAAEAEKPEPADAAAPKTENSKRADAGSGTQPERSDASVDRQHDAGHR
jgi:hypothetical protein